MRYKDSPEVFKKKCREYFEILENGKQNENEKFSDGTLVKWFFMSHFLAAYREVSLRPNRDQFPKAYKIIKEKYKKMKKNNDYVMTFEEKCEKYFQIIERDNRKPKTTDLRTFQDKSSVGQFWTAHSGKIYLEVCKEENQKKFPNAYQILMFEYHHLIQKRNNKLTFKEKVDDILKTIENIEIPLSSSYKLIFDNGVNKSNFFRVNLDRIYKFIDNDEYKNKYPKAYQIVRKEYKKLLKTQRKHIINKSDFWNIKKKKDQIVQLCKEYNINQEINKKVLNFISYKELIVKLEYLIDKGIEIMNAEGLLHPIFSMSNNNMQMNYDVSLEQLINDYINKDDFKLK